MIKRQLKTFLATVADHNTEKAEVICNTFLTNSANNKEFVGEFVVVWTEFDNTSLTPSDAQEPTFEESIRIHNNASAEAFLNTYPFGIEDWIQAKLKEAFGANCDVAVRPFVSRSGPNK